MIKHTFVILGYKESPFLQECIDSLKQQTIRSNIILATSTPTAYLQDIAKKNKIPFHVNPKKKGIASDWNFAFSLAQTEYVTLAHQDDIYLSIYTESILNESSSRVPIIAFSDYLEIDELGKNKQVNLTMRVKRILLTLFFPFKKFLEMKPLKKLFLSFGSPICCPTVMYNKNLLSDFLFSNEFTINLDWDAWYRIAKEKGVFLYIKDKVVKHRIHDESETSAGIIDNRRRQEDLKMFSRFWPSWFVAVIMKFYSITYTGNFE